MASNKKSNAGNYLGGDIDNSCSNDDNNSNRNRNSNKKKSNNFGNEKSAPSGARSRRRGGKGGGSRTKIMSMDLSGGENEQRQDLSSSFRISVEIPNIEAPLLPRKRSQATKSPVPPDSNSAGDDNDNDDDEDENEQFSGGDQEVFNPPLHQTVKTAGGQIMPTDGGYGAKSTIAVKNNIGGNSIQIDNNEVHEELNARVHEQQNDWNASAVATSTAAAGAGVADNLLSKQQQQLLSKQQQQQLERSSTSLPTGRRSTDNDPKKHMTPKRRRKQCSTQTPQQQDLQSQPKHSSSEDNRHIDGESNNTNDINSVLFSPKPTNRRHRHKSQNEPPSTASRRPRPPAPPSPMITSTIANTSGAAPSSPSSSHIQSQSSLLSPSSDVTTSTTTPFRFHSFPASLPRVNPRSGRALSRGEEEDEEGDEFGRSNEYDNEFGDIQFDDREHGQNPFLSTTSMPATARKQPLTLYPRRNRRDVMLPSSISDANTATAIGRPPPSPASRRLFVPRSRSMDEKWADNNSKEHTYLSSNRVGHAASFSPSSSSSSSTSSSSSSSCQSPERNDKVRMLNNEAPPATVVKKSEVNKCAKRLDEDDDQLLNENDESGSSTLSFEEDVSGKRLNFNSPLPPQGSGDGDIQYDHHLPTLPQPPHPPPPRQALETALHPHTPRGILLTAASANAEGQMHMMPNLEVSPITRFPDDYDDDCHEMVVDSTTTTGDGNDDFDNDGGSASALDNFLPPTARMMNAEVGISGINSENLNIVDTSAHSYSAVNIGSNDTSNASAASLLSRQSVDTNESTATTVNKTNLSHSHTLNTTTITTTHRPTARKSRRPMPDTSAFDISGGNIHTPSQQSLGSKDSGFHSHKTGGTAAGSISSGGGGSHHQAARLFCPPTPIRTPAWAHHAAVDRGGGHGGHHVLKRANSLISTKVLAMMPCPPRVLDNLSSLEDSMLENDISGSTLDTTTMESAGGRGGEVNELPILPNNPNQDAFLSFPGEEKDEHNECMFRSLESGCGDEETSKSWPNDQSQEEISSVVHGGEGSVPGPSPNSSIGVDDVNFSDFENLGTLGSGAFADVYKVRSRKRDRRMYAIKRTRRQFRGVKDRDRAMAEVNTMKLLQSALFSEAAAAASTSSSHHQERQDSSSNSARRHSKNNYGLYLLFFIRAWQQDGFFYCQTELCSRATCRHLRLSLSCDWARDVVRYPSLKLCLMEKGANIDIPPVSGEGNKEMTFNDDRLLPERAVWQICHDISRGLFHIHSHGMVHYDIKPSNIFFAYNSKWGAICKIGDFGLAGDIGTRDDGQEGDTAYMPSEVLLSSCEKHPSADVFSLGLALYELAASHLWSLPREGERWHEIRSGTHRPDLPPSRSESLLKLIQVMTRPSFKERPSAESILELMEVKLANATSDSFLSRYITDVERYDLRREKEIELAEEEARRRSSTPISQSLGYNTLGSDTARRTRDLRTPTNDDGQPSTFPDKDANAHER